MWTEIIAGCTIIVLVVLAILALGLDHERRK